MSSGCMDIFDLNSLFMNFACLICSLSCSLYSFCVRPLSARARRSCSCVSLFCFFTSSTALSISRSLMSMPALSAACFTSFCSTRLSSMVPFTSFNLSGSAPSSMPSFSMATAVAALSSDNVMTLSFMTATILSTTSELACPANTTEARLMARKNLFKAVPLLSLSWKYASSRLSRHPVRTRPFRP